MITCNAVQTASNVWIVDTGATDHMTPDFKLLRNVKVAASNLTVNLPTGDKAVVSHVGDVCLENGLQLLNVLYVLVFTHNLLSIHKLSNDNGCYAVFSPSACKIVDTQSHTVRSTGTVSNWLYYLSTSSSAKSSVNLEKQCLTVLTPSLSEQYTLWHNRLGHAPASKLNFIDCIKHCTHVSYQVCLTCPMTKFTKLPFPLSESHAAKAFELVHTDIWGPYNISTRKKFSYFLTIVDDYSRMTWIYLMQHNSDFLKTLELFNNFVQNKFSSSIKVLRSDNAREFDDVECKKFFQAQGIVHQTSCNYRPQ